MDQPKPLPPSLRSFALAFLAHWFTAMSGPLSVPAAIAALWIENPTGKILLGLTAIVCFWAAAYQVWRRERERVVELEAGVGVAGFESCHCSHRVRCYGH